MGATSSEGTGHGSAKKTIPYQNKIDRSWNLTEPKIVAAGRAQFDEDGFLELKIPAWGYQWEIQCDSTSCQVFADDPIDPVIIQATYIDSETDLSQIITVNLGNLNQPNVELVNGSPKLQEALTKIIEFRGEPGKHFFYTICTSGNATIIPNPGESNF